MYSLEERLLAVKTYYEMGRDAKATVRRLGYPDETNIARWAKKYERDHGLHEHRVHCSKYTDSEKRAAMQRPLHRTTLIEFRLNATSALPSGETEWD